MRCEEVREHLVDARVARAPLPPELHEHLRECAACRAEDAALADLWTALDDAVRLRPARDATEALVARARGEMEQSKRRTTMRNRTLLAAGFLLTTLAGAALGLVLGGDDGSADAGPVASAERQFLLLLHEEPSAGPAPPPEQIAAVVAEYRDWAMSLRAEGRLVSAEKLAHDGGRWLEEAPAGNRDDVVSGYFVVHARDYNDALRIARSSPHLRYGGRIEVRAIERT